MRQSCAALFVATSTTRPAALVAIFRFSGCLVKGASITLCFFSVGACSLYNYHSLCVDAGLRHKAIHFRVRVGVRLYVHNAMSQLLRIGQKPVSAYFWGYKAVFFNSPLRAGFHKRCFAFTQTKKLAGDPPILFLTELVKRSPFVFAPSVSPRSALRNARPLPSVQRPTLSRAPSFLERDAALDFPKAYTCAVASEFYLSRLAKLSQLFARLLSAGSW